MGDSVYPYICNLSIAGVQVSLALRYEKTVLYFGKYAELQNSKDHSQRSIRFPEKNNDKELSVHVPEEEWSEWLSEGGSDNAYGEYTCSTAIVSDVLLQNDRCIIHAAAFRFGNGAWLISGPSGTGKSTQLFNLQKICPSKFTVICGDRPAMELCKDGTVYVHPAPWNGKEGWQGAEGAPLKGLILLKRGEKNSFSRIKAEKAVFPLLCSLIHTAGTEQNILDLARFTDIFLKRIPVYQLTSHEVPASTKLMYKALFSERCLK